MKTNHLLLHPRLQPLTIHSGDGCHVFDAHGRSSLDLISGIGVNALGYNHPRISAAIADQAWRSIHTSALYSRPFAAPLADELCRISGMDKVLFTNSGTEATEAALKLARCHAATYHRAKTHIVALKNSFHGRSRAALAVAGQCGLHDPFAPYGFEVSFVAANDVDAMRAAVRPDTAAVILEAVQGEGGVYPLSADFLHATREATREHHALLIADECQCGLGRTGRVFAYEWSGVLPDIVNVAKPLAGGLPLGAVMFTAAVAETFPSGTHGSTFAGGSLACRVALEFLSVMESLLPHVRSVGEVLRDGLNAMRQRVPVIREVRALGLMIGVQLDRPGAVYVERALQRGMLINCTQDNVIRLLPPYVMTEEEAREGLFRLEEILTEPAA